MEAEKKLALLSGGPFNGIKTVSDFADELCFWPRDQKRMTLAEYLPGTFLSGGDKQIEYRYKAIGNIFEVGDSQIRPYSYIGCY